MLSILHLIDVSEYMYITQEDLEETIKTLKYLNVAYEVYIVQDKMYRITWYDYIDEEWTDIWCTSDEYEETLPKVIEAGVEYEVTEFN
jgi:hypothetical protein